MTEPRLHDGDAERRTRLIVSLLDGLPVVDALQIVHGVAQALLRAGDRSAFGARVPRQHGEYLSTAEAADYLAARLGGFAPTLATLRSWKRPSRRRRYAHLDLPAPAERWHGKKGHRWRRQDLDDWIDRRLNDGSETVVSLNSVDVARGRLGGAALAARMRARRSA